MEKKLVEIPNEGPALRERESGRQGNVQEKSRFNEGEQNKKESDVQIVLK